ncbi:membrane protein [Gordonia alkanivorans]|uniref:membrane protein n=1 Tax=Gordonia alkanivorans TaxID=84096 RepID=UPI0005871AA9|nr:membrane protein [Gordonia alkanivorans]
MASTDRESKAARVFGLVLAGVGIAHWLRPAAFDDLTSRAFPTDTRRWTLRNGTTEALLGVAIASRRLRPVGLVGLLGYVAFLAWRGVQARG